MPSQASPILAVIDCAADDAEVVAEAVWLARAAHTDVVLVHVARRVAAGRPDSFDDAFRQIGAEQRALSRLLEVAEQERTSGVAVRVDDVYFGDASNEVAYAASRLRASAVVAARRPGRWLAWRSRDVRLARLLSVPLVLIDARSAERRTLETLAEFEVVPDERLLPSTPAPAPDAATTVNHRANRAA